MASLKKIVRDNPLSNFRQGVASSAGTGFALLADAAEAAYDRVLPAATKEMEGLFTDEMRQFAKDQVGDPSGAVTMSGMGSPTALGLLREFEGFRDTPYWDVNALRTGYGSDTITDASGAVRKVGAGDRVTRADAERDLSRRVSTEFEPRARDAVGAERWAAMSEGQRAAVTSIAYNYGSVPDRIVGALRSGDSAAAAAAIRGLAGDNDGINAKRRNREADIFGGATVTTSTQNVMIRDKDGALQPRLFSPTAGPLLQVANAAAGVAYQSEVMLNGMSDIMDLSRQFEVNPEGFQQAVDGYVSDMVAKAPEMFREDVRAGLTKEAYRRFEGMVEEKHRDTMQRANNSSAALVDRWSDNLAEAYAGGNPEEIALAQSELDGLLRAREAIPGIAWTPEQSENARIEARKAGERLTAARQTKQTAAWKSDLSLVAKSAMEGVTAAQEALLSNPLVQQLLPDEWLNAAMAVEMRESLPDIFAMPPSKVKAGLEASKLLPVEHESQLAMMKTVEATQKQMATDYAKNPIEAAQKYLPEEETPDPQNPDIIRPGKPAPLVLDPTDPGFMSSLSGRLRDAAMLQAQGYTKDLVLVTPGEAEAFGAIFGRETPPEMKLAAAGMIVQALGDDASPFFNQIKAEPVTRMTGMMLARGGSESVAMEAMRGQAMLDEGIAQSPSKDGMRDAVPADVGVVLDALPESAQGDVMQTAAAIFAARTRGVTDADVLTAKKAEAVQAALGQTNDGIKIRGGVQEVGAGSALLPPDVAGEDADAALERAFQSGTFDPASPLSAAQQMGAVGGAVWVDAGMSSPPMLGGAPLSTRSLRHVQLTPLGGSRYRLSLAMPGGPVDAVDASGKPYDFDLPALIEASR